MTKGVDNVGQRAAPPPPPQDEFSTVLKGVRGASRSGPDPSAFRAADAAADVPDGGAAPSETGDGAQPRDVGDALRTAKQHHPGDRGFEASVDALTSQPGFKELTPSEQRQRIGVEDRAWTAGDHHPGDLPFASTLQNMVHSPQYQSLGPLEQVQRIGALDHGGPATADQGSLAAHVMAGLKSPEAKRKLDALLKDPSYQASGRLTRDALLHQAENYGNDTQGPAVIDGLRQLAGRPWFDASSAADQQRGAALFAHMLSHGKASPILADTAAALLGMPNVNVTWGDENMMKTYMGPDWHPDAFEVQLGRSSVPDGNGRLGSAGGAANFLASKVNYMLNDDAGAPQNSYRDFVGQYRNAFVAYKAEHGNQPPSRQAAFDMARDIVSSQAETGAQYNLPASAADQAKITAFLQDLTRQPDVTYANVQAQHPLAGAGAQPAPLPPKADDGDPYILDNHFAGR